MNFTTVGKSYGGPSSSSLGASNSLNPDTTVNTLGSVNSSFNNQTQERPGVEGRVFGNKNEGGF